MIIQQEHVRLRRKDPSSSISEIEICVEGEYGIAGTKPVAIVKIGHRTFQLYGRIVQSGVAWDMNSWADVLLDVE
jgi:hypothetical protein